VPYEIIVPYEIVPYEIVPYEIIKIFMRSCSAV